MLERSLAGELAELCATFLYGANLQGLYCGRRAKTKVRPSRGNMAFEVAAKLSEIPPGSIKEVLVGGQAIALANVGGRLYAIHNTCLHRGGPLGEGQLEGSIVTCPWHGWQFDVTTGKAVQNPNAGVGCMATEIHGDEVYIDLL